MLWKVTKNKIHTEERVSFCAHRDVKLVFSVLGSAMEALHSIQNFLKGRPKSFKSIDDAIEWRSAFRVQHILSSKVVDIDLIIRLVLLCFTKFYFVSPNLNEPTTNQQLFTCLKQDPAQVEFEGRVS